ncbi:type IV toxin-antitoxin system AbiEi family antitoxin domain-containing protein [Novosphingobium kaempferiae]|uniref:type IV toxin-antitoxin system AbiEi family antitoxin domain-containing protein n=1 Tax=Novosphingobium kaempferiae TaxID=2896849 RepID=UPI001E525163|nr:type IV toxin-antitoxin system AbiEi family antitoxin domain-containing protein [Novosphingobium kaempferiae]
MQKQTIDGSGACSIAARRAGRPLSVLTVLERRVVALLRTAGDVQHGLGSVQSPLRGILERLADEVEINGLVVFGEQSRFVSDDEIAILSWLSMLQRPSQSAHLHMANPFQQALRALADALLDEDRRLPARSILAEDRIAREGCFRMEFQPDTAADPVPDAGAESAEARALALVERCRFATASQFRALGISTQKLSRLCRRGYVERVALGLYKKPGASGAMLAS